MILGKGARAKEAISRSPSAPYVVPQKWPELVKNTRYYHKILILGRQRTWQLLAPRPQKRPELTKKTPKPLQNSYSALVGILTTCTWANNNYIFIK